MLEKELNEGKPYAILMGTYHSESVLSTPKDDKIHLVYAGTFNPKKGGVFNAIVVKGNYLGTSMFYGRGAGKFPTASAVVADIMDIVEKMSIQNVPSISWTNATDCDIADENEYLCPRCIIFNGKQTEGKYIENLNLTALITNSINKNDAIQLANSISQEYKIYPII